MDSISFSVLVLALVAALGLLLGRLQFKTLGLGIAGVLFAGIIVAQFRPAVDAHVLHFARDLGLVLFVYMTGMQVGRGFLTSFREHGIGLNLMSVAVVLGGAAITALACYLGQIDMALAVGLFSGATTNTPSLAAAQEALRTIPALDTERLQMPGLGYAVSYPFGVMGIILSMVAVRLFFRIDPGREAERLQRKESSESEISRVNLVVRNANLSGRTVREISALGNEVVVSRIKPKDQAEALLAQSDRRVEVGDVLLAVGPQRALEQFRLIVGEVSPLDLTQQKGPLTFRRVVVTKPDAVGKTLGEFSQLFAIKVTRVSRADIELSARADLKLEFGDLLHIVGEEAAIGEGAKALGNSLRDLGHSQLIPVFGGIALGVALGMIPFHLPGLPAPVRLGLAGGPLLVAILLSRIGKIGPIICYVAPSANAALREVGIVLFLAAVGLKAGDHFVETLFSTSGLWYIAWAVSITIIPLLLIAGFARLVLKMNFIPLCGLLAGSMTDPPALAFANAMARSEASSVAYASVYPLTMLLRILAAQLLVILFAR